MGAKTTWEKNGFIFALNMGEGGLVGGCRVGKEKRAKPH